MRVNAERSFMSRSDHVHLDKIVARFPSCLIGIGVYCSGTQPNEVRVGMDTIAVFMTEKMNYGAIAHHFIDWILIQEPVGRVVAQDDVCDVFLRVEHRLHPAKIKGAAQIFLTVESRY